VKKEERVECGGDEAQKSGDCGHNLYKLSQVEVDPIQQLNKLGWCFAPLVDPRGGLPKRG
jgi:hypothetical protein